MKRPSLNRLYAQLNEQLFDGALPSCTVRGLYLKADKFALLSRPNLGFTVHARHVIYIVKNPDFEGQRRVLIHEMCHVATKGEGVRLHGPRFLACLKRVADGEPWLEDEVSIYEGVFPGYPAGTQPEWILDWKTDDLLSGRRRPPWRIARQHLAKAVDVDEGAFEQEYPQAFNRWTQKCERRQRLRSSQREKHSP